MISFGVPSCHCPLLSAYFKANGNFWDWAVVAILKVNTLGTVKGLNSDEKKNQKEKKPKKLKQKNLGCLNLLMDDPRLAPMESCTHIAGS